VRHRIEVVVKGKKVKQRKINPNVVNNPIYTDLCGMTHEQEVYRSPVARITAEMTSCNSFVGTAGRAMGAKIFLGAFDLPKLLTQFNKIHAWVPSSRKAPWRYFYAFHDGQAAPGHFTRV